MKTISNLFLLALCFLAFGACNKIEEAATIKVPVPDLAINFPATITAAPAPALYSLQAGDALNSFEGSATLNITAPEFATFKKYRNVITSINVKAISVKITADNGTRAENITLTASGVGNYTIANYTFGQQYVGDAALITFANKIINHLTTNDSVTIDVTGQSDATQGNLNVSISITGIEVWAKTIKF